MSLLPPNDEPVVYWVDATNSQQGPEPLGTVIARVIHQQIPDSTLVWWDGLDQWVAFNTIADMQSRVAEQLTPAETPVSAPSNAIDTAWAPAAATASTEVPAGELIANAPPADETGTSYGASLEHGAGPSGLDAPIAASPIEVAPEDLQRWGADAEDVEWAAPDGADAAAHVVAVTTAGSPDGANADAAAPDTGIPAAAMAETAAATPGSTFVDTAPPAAVHAQGWTAPVPTDGRTTAPDAATATATATATDAAATDAAATDDASADDIVAGLVGRSDALRRDEYAASSAAERLITAIGAALEQRGFTLQASDAPRDAADDSGRPNLDSTLHAIDERTGASATVALTCDRPLGSLAQLADARATLDLAMATPDGSAGRDLRIRLADYVAGDGSVDELLVDHHLGALLAVLRRTTTR
jgi:hypothetical protein